MPDNVHVLTLEPWVNGTHLLRLEHVYDAGEDQTLAQPATVELDVIFFKSLASQCSEQRNITSDEMTSQKF